MEDDQQFCLRWNNHQSTLIQNFDTLLESGTLVDCTLAAEGKYLKAHKVVLSACSPYFEGLLSEHYDKHPVFILKDVKFKELKAMMDYMYRGEVNISQDQLTALLKAAESLQIKGLSDSRTGGGAAGGSATSSSKTETRSAKAASSTAATSSSLDIPHASSGLTIEKNSKVPRQSLQQVSVSDLPEDSASPQLRGLSSREGSQSPTSRKRLRKRKRSVNNDDTNSMENHEASNSSDVNISAPALGVAPVATEEKSHADPAETIGRSALMQQLTKPADEMLQIPIEKPEPSEEMIQPKSEYLDDQDDVEDLTNLDDDMNDLNEMEQDNSRAGPSHDPSQHGGIASWHISGDRSNASVVGAAAGPPGQQDEVFLAAHEAAQAQRDSQATPRIKIRKLKDMESDKKLSKDPSGNDDTFYQEAQHIKEEIIDVEDNEESSSFLNTNSEYSDLQDEKNGDANSVLTRAMDNWDRQKKLGILMEIKCEECHLTWEKPVNLDCSYNGLGYIDCPECDGEMMYQCSRCKQHFQKYDKICKHLEQKCYVNYDVPESSRTIQRFDYQVTLASILEVKCKECDLTLESPDNLDYKFDQEYKKCEVSYIDCPECDGEMKYQCPNCKMQFRKYDKAYRHLKRICYVDIVFEASKTKQVKSNIVRNCSYCEYSTTNLTDLRRHYSIAHQKTKSTLSSCHICWRCNNRYKTRETMLKHARFCGLAPHIACNFCSYRTKRSEHLRIHIQHKHPGPEFRNGDAYHCPKCKKKYKYLMSMKSHARRCRKTGEEEDEDN